MNLLCPRSRMNFQCHASSQCEQEVPEVPGKTANRNMLDSMTTGYDQSLDGDLGYE